MFQAAGVPKIEVTFDINVEVRGVTCFFERMPGRRDVEDFGGRGWPLWNHARYIAPTLPQ